MASVSKVNNGTAKHFQAKSKPRRSKRSETPNNGVELIRKDHSSALEFMKVALLRNDASIRHSESKAGFLFSFTSIIFGLFYKDIVVYKTLLSQYDLWGTLSIVAIGTTFLGVLVVTFSTFMVVIPRLGVSKVPTLLYFEYIQSIPENDLYAIAANLDAEKSLKDLTTQVRVTSIIVSKKYYYVRIGIFGAVSVFLGWVTATLTLLITQ